MRLGDHAPFLETHGNSVRLGRSASNIFFRLLAFLTFLIYCIFLVRTSHYFSHPILCLRSFDVSSHLPLPCPLRPTLSLRLSLLTSASSAVYQGLLVSEFLRTKIVIVVSHRAVAKPFNQSSVFKKVSTGLLCAFFVVLGI